MSDLALIVGAALSCFALGWGFGRSIKTARQLFDHI